MGKTVKAVVGAGLLLATGGITAGILGSVYGAVSITSNMYMLVSGLVTLAGASLVGSALTPEAPDIEGTDGYAGQKLQTKKDNVSAVPVVFGENRVGSSIIWQSTGEQVSGAENKDYWSVQVLAEGEINSFEELYANEDTMVSKGSNKFTTKYAHIKGYTTSGVSGMNLADVEFVKLQDGTSDTASNISLDTATTDQTKQVFTFSGNVDHELYMTIRCATASGGTYSGTGTSGTLETGVANAGGYYDEYGEGWHGDLTATINYTPFDSDNLTASKMHYAELSGVSGGTITIIQQPSSSNNYEAKVKIYEPGGGEQSCGFTLTMKEGTGVRIPPNVAFIATHQVFNATDNAHTQLDNITAKIQGLKVRTVTASGFSTVAYTTNPAEQVAEVMTNGLSIDSSKIDFTSFNNAKTKCNDYGYTSNITLNTQTNVQSVITDLLSTCRGQIIFSQGLWKLKIDEKSQSVAKTLTEDDILNNSLNISMKGFSEIANKIDVKYVNPNDNWLSAKVELQDADLINLDGQTITKTLDIKGVTSSTQANKLAEITLNTMRYSEDASGNRLKQTPLAIAFATTVKNAELEVGDVISIDHSLMDRVRKFVILSVESDQSGAIQISCREYCETHYKDSSGTYLI